MTIALVTRGYIYPRPLVGVEPFDGPDIIGVSSSSPNITGSGVDTPSGPSITGAATSGPVISSSKSPADTPAADAPSIVGAGLQTPDIAGSEEE